MTRWFVLLLVLLTTCFLCADDMQVIAAAHKTTHKIEMPVLIGAPVHCSATAIGPHALLTASHCEKPTTKIVIDGRPCFVLGYARDDKDHTILLVNATFKYYAAFADTWPKLGEDIFLFGNPGSTPDILHKGFTAKVPRKPTVLEETRRLVIGSGRPPAMAYYDFNGWPGDSGAAIFNEQGKIVGVVSGGLVQGKEGWPAYKLLMGFVLDFDVSVVKAAQQFAPPTSKE